ncbi:MAG TPA: cell division protein FtsQ/DivIB [Burkholderiales bacterium]|nr:cell division protein FtsQ/DivIB [Burkholderiales bacterium]
MWDSAPALNRISDVLFAAAALLALYGAIRFAIVQPIFSLNELRVVGATGHIERAQVEAIAKRDIKGTFFTFDIVQVRDSFEKLPWVRKADVRRQWPHGIEVVIEAHQPLARWSSHGNDGLVNLHGEVFKGTYGGTLPVFSGPAGTSVEIAVQYDVFRRELAAVGREPVQVRLSPRRAWQVRLDNGMTLEVGREQVPARLARFLAAYPHTIAPLGRNADYVDLRYANGFAVRVPDMAKAKGGSPKSQTAQPRA